MSAYAPPAASSSSWVPSSAIRPPSSTAIRFARRTLAEAVRDHDARDAGGELEEAVVEGGLGAHVELGGRLVEHEHPRSVLDRVKRPGERDPLPLAAGQADASVVVGREDRVPAAWQLGDQLRRAGTFDGYAPASAGSGGPSANSPTFSAAREREPREVLVDDRHLALPLALAQPAERNAVDRDRAASRLAHARQQGHERRLAGAVDADQPERVAERKVELEIAQHRLLAAGVGERHVFEADAASGQPGRGQRLGDPVRVGDGGSKRGRQRVEVRQRRQHLREADVGERDRPRRHARRQHHQHRRERPQRDLTVVGGISERAGGERVRREHERAGDPHPAREPPELPPRRPHARRPLLAVAVGGPVAEPEDPHLLGRRRTPREAEQVPAAAQGRRRLARPRRLEADSGAERAPDEQPHHEHRQPEPPVERREYRARQHAGEAVAEERDERHRRAFRLAAEQLSAGRGELFEHLPVLEMLDPRRRAHRLHQPALHQPVDAGVSGGRERVLERPAHQGQRVRRAGERQRQDQPVSLGGGQPERDRVGDPACDAAHQDKHEHRQDALGDHEHHRERAQTAARLPQQGKRT